MVAHEQTCCPLMVCNGGLSGMRKQVYALQAYCIYIIFVLNLLLKG